MFKYSLFLIFSIILLTQNNYVNGGAAAYGICQSGCNSVTTACYAGAGFTFGLVTFGVGTPAAFLACSKAQGACMAACVAAGAAPFP